MDEKTPWELASEWFARTLAIVVVMVAPGALGAWLDKQLGTTFFTLAGFLVGMLVATGMLLLYSRIKPTDGRRETTGRETVAGQNPATTQNTAAGEQAERPQAGTANSSAAAPGNRMRPSELPLPNLPGAEVLEPRKNDE